MVAVGAGEGALVLRLVLVVELLHDPLAQLLGDRLGVEAGGDRPRQPHDRAGVAEVGVERLGDPRVLDLHRDLAPVEQLGPVHLADRGGGEGLGLDLGEELGERFAVVFLLQHLDDLLPGHRRRVGAQFRQLLLVDLAVLLGDELGVDEGGELAELHRRALHLAERADHLHRRFQVALLELLFAALLGAADVGRFGARVAGALDADDRAQLGRAADPALGDLGVVSHAAKVATRSDFARFSILSRPMASARSTLKVAPRAEFGSRTTRRLRGEGLVPGVVYSGGSEATAFQVSEREVRAVISEGAALFDLEIEGSKAVPVVVKEQQLHPVRGSLQHIDLQAVKLDEAIEAEVAIELEGADDRPRRQRRRRARARHPRDHRRSAADRHPRPHRRRRLGDGDQRHLQLSAIAAPDGVTFVAEDPEEVTIVTLSPPRVEEEPEPEVEEETELVGEGEAGEGEAAEGDSGDSEGE